MKKPYSTFTMDKDVKEMIIKHCEDKFTDEQKGQFKKIAKILEEKLRTWEYQMDLTNVDSGKSHRFYFGSNKNYEELKEAIREWICEI